MKRLLVFLAALRVVLAGRKYARYMCANPTPRACAGIRARRVCAYAHRCIYKLDRDV